MSAGVLADAVAGMVKLRRTETGVNLINMTTTSPLTELADKLPPEWKWAALFGAPQGFEREWRAWLGAAVHEEELALLRWWGQRADRAA